MGFILATPTSDRYSKLPYNARSLEKFPLSDAYVENMFIDTNGSRRYVQEYIPSTRVSNFLGGLGFVDPATAITLAMFGRKLLGKILPSSPKVKIENMSEWDTQVLKKGTPPTEQGKFMVWGGGIPATHFKVWIVFSNSLLKTINTWAKWKAFKKKLESKGFKNIDYMFEVRDMPNFWRNLLPQSRPPVLLHKNYMSKGIVARHIWSGGRRYDALFKTIHINPSEAPAVPLDPMPMGVPINGFDMKLLLIPAGVVFVGGLAYLLIKK